MTVEELLAALQAIIDSADSEGRDLTDEEVARYEELEGKLTAARRSAEIRARQVAYTTPVRSDVGVHVAAPKADDTLERAFDHYIRTGRENADLVELRAQGEAAGSEGGYLVPDGFRDKVVDRLKAFGGIANVVETVTTSTGNPLPWVTVDDTANVGEIVQEGATFSSGADLVFGTASLTAYKYASSGAGAAPLRVSVELLQDSAIDIQSLVSRKLGERIARIQSTHLVRGNGAGQPKGIVYGLTPVQPAANTGWTYDDLITFIHSVDPAYRDGARWAFNDATLATIKKMKDSHGDPIWRPAEATMATGTEGGTLLGYPITVDQAFVDLDIDDSTDLCGVFGNLSEGYVIRRVKDITMVVNPWTRAAYGEVEFSAWARMDATQQNTNSYVALSGKS